MCVWNTVAVFVLLPPHFAHRSMFTQRTTRPSRRTSARAGRGSAAAAAPPAPTRTKQLHASEPAVAQVAQGIASCANEQRENETQPQHRRPSRREARRGDAPPPAHAAGSDSPHAGTAAARSSASSMLPPPRSAAAPSASARPGACAQGRLEDATRHAKGIHAPGLVVHDVGVSRLAEHGHGCAALEGRVHLIIGLSSGEV